MTFSAVLTRDADEGYVALDPETGTTTQGDSVADALDNLKKATELYLEEFPMKRTVPSLVSNYKVVHA
jgi:predicted RNase H-like HicB family nuclease